MNNIGICVFAILLCAGSISVRGQGSLTPPGPPAPGMKTLEQIEPRRPIASLPFSITTSGAYYVVSNLSITSGAGISITAHDVDLDLNGCTLTGAPATDSGITVPAIRTNIVIRNGTVRNWGAHGIRSDFAANLRVERVQALRNGQAGILASAEAMILHCTADGNATWGILTSARSVIRSCIAINNGSTGIRVDISSIVSECIARGNAIGFSANGSSTFERCVASGSSQRGFHLGGTSQALHCIADDNGTDGFRLEVASQAVHCIARTNGGHGIDGAQGVAVLGCTARQNVQAGITVGAGSRVENSASTLNSHEGIVSAERCTITRNTSVGNSRDGIRASTQCSVLNNHSQNNGPPGSVYDGIYITGAHNVIEGNHVSSNGRHGIRLETTSSLNVVLRNVAVQNGSANYSFSGSNDTGPIANASSATSPTANISF